MLSSSFANEVEIAASGMLIVFLFDETNRLRRIEMQTSWEKRFRKRNNPELPARFRDRFSAGAECARLYERDEVSGPLAS